MSPSAREAILGRVADVAPGRPQAVEGSGAGNEAEALGWDVIVGEKAEVLGDTTALSGGALCTRSAHQRQQLNLINI